MITKEQACNAIKELAEYLERDHVRLTASNNYSINETQTVTNEKRILLDTCIAYSNDRIDALVYELYGWTEEEIKFVEGEGNARNY